MSFASRYIQNNIVSPAFIQESPDNLLGMIVIIPVYNEPEVLKALDSLAGCNRPEKAVEILLVINQAIDTPAKIIQQNKETIRQIENWRQANSDTFFRLFTLIPPPFSKKHAGAGMARKTGMDEAIRRFSEVGRPDGILISLDADTLVDPNYFIEIERFLRTNSGCVGLCIKFKHRTEEIEDEMHQRGMLLYEKYLHYYKNALAFTGYPHAIHTVGSAFAVKADAYVKQGGMNRRQAGEDFYFLHKLSQLGTIGELDTTCVYPSARLSDRVPFGTGPVLQKWIHGDKSLMKTYHVQAFLDLKYFFELVPMLYESNRLENERIMSALPEALVLFLEEDNFMDMLIEIKNNSSRLDSFGKRFFQNFSAFKILKFLNFSHPKYYPFQDLEEADVRLQKMS